MVLSPTELEICALYLRISHRNLRLSESTEGPDQRLTPHSLSLEQYLSAKRRIFSRAEGFADVMVG